MKGGLTCMDEKDYTNLAVKVEGIDSRCKSNEHRLDEHDEELKDLREDTKTLIKLTNSVDVIATSIADVNKKVDVIGTKQDKLNAKVTVLENKPAEETKRRLDGLYDKLLWLIVGGIAVGILSQTIPSIPW